MKNILIPTDFSDCSKAGILTALLLAKRLQAAVYFFHNRAEKELDSSLQMQELINTLDFEGLSITCIEKEGNLLRNIVDFIKEAEIDLVVMGTHGTNGLKEWSIGSFAQKMVRLAPCPVLAVKEPIQDIRFDNIVFVSNFDLEARPAFEWTGKFAKNFESKLHMLNVDTPNYFTEIPFLIDEAMDEFETLYEGSVVQHRIRSWNVEAGLKKFLTEQQADLIIVPTHGKRGLRSLFFNSIAEGIVNHLDYPILTIKI